MDPNTITMPDGRVLPRLRQVPANIPRLPQGFGSTVALPSAPIMQGRAPIAPQAPQAPQEAPQAPMAPQAPYDPLSSVQTRQAQVGQAMEAKANGEPQYTPAASNEAPAEEQWSATGKTDSFGQFFNKRQGTDSLTAFGAAMLKAPNFLTGLADGALAVNQVDRENRMPSPEEIARANMRYKIANGQSLAKEKTVKQTEAGYDASGKLVTRIVFSDGTQRFLDETNQEMPNGAPGWERATDQNRGKGAALNLVDLNKDQAAAGAAYANIGRFQKMQSLLDSGDSGAGTGVYASLARGIATMTGGSFMGTDVEVMQQYEKMASTGELEAAISQKGLGQLTEGEREIIRRSVNTITTDPKAAKEIMNVFVSRERRLIAMADAWDAANLDGSKYNTWKLRFMGKWDAEQGNDYTPATQAAPAAPAKGATTVLKYDANGDPM